MTRLSHLGVRRLALNAAGGALLFAVAGIGHATSASALTLPAIGGSGSGTQVNVPSLAIPAVPGVGVPTATPTLPSLTLPSLCPPLCVGPTPPPCVVDCGPFPCLVNCTPAPCTTCGTTGSGQTSAGTTATGTDPALGGAQRVSRGVPLGHGSGDPTLTVAAVPPVLTLAPGNALSFGNAPFLWPLIAGLDVLAAGAVVMVVRKTWSKRPAD